MSKLTPAAQRETVDLCQLHTVERRDSDASMSLRPSVAGYLLFMEVLDEVRRLCLSQDCTASAMLGTDLGDRLRDALERCTYAVEATKKGHLLAFF